MSAAPKLTPKRPFACDRCYGNGITPHLHIAKGVCFKCGGRGTLPYDPQQKGADVDDAPEPDYDAYIQKRELDFWENYEAAEAEREEQAWFDENDETHLPVNGVQDLNAAVTVYEAPLSAFAPVVPELSDTPDVDDSYLPEVNVRLYVEADAREKRVNEAVEHPSTSDCVYGVCKGDRVRVTTSNPNIPFEGRVEKLTWDGRVIVRNGSITYRTRVECVTMLARAEGREEALASVETEVNAL